MSRCCILGLGYIGLPTAAIIAKAEHIVTGVDVNEKVISTINKGSTHFFEPGLEDLIKEAVSSGKLKASNIPYESDIFIIAVPTPFKENNSRIPEPNLEYVLSAAKSISPFLRNGNLIIIESTSPVGTTETVKNIIKKHASCDIEKVHICYCPERVIPGNIIKELETNNRVIGGLKKIDGQIAKSFYQTFCKGEINITDARTAELVKLTENTYRDINIAFANELSIISDHLKIDVRELIEISNKHPRVNILQPGCGVGGHCIAIDPWFLAYALPESSNLIQAARKVNNEKINWVTNKIKNSWEQIKIRLGREPIVGSLGLTFKPDVDDIRESPAKKIVDNLIEAGIKLAICEPNLKNIEGMKLDSIDYVQKNSDLIIILVAHKEFKSLNLKGKIFIDFCGAIN